MFILMLLKKMKFRRQRKKLTEFIKTIISSKFCLDNNCQGTDVNLQLKSFKWGGGGERPSNILFVKVNISVKIFYEDDCRTEKISVRQTVKQFKKYIQVFNYFKLKKINC